MVFQVQSFGGATQLLMLLTFSVVRNRYEESLYGVIG